MAVFASKQIVMPVVLTPIAVTITGTGDSKYCYATINGTKQYTAGTREVNAGDTITFGVFGNRNYSGLVEIDGKRVLRVISGSTETYDWIVPDGISTVEIAMNYRSAGSRPSHGAIDVTTS